jgi:hypothetical protein
MFTNWQDTGVSGSGLNEEEVMALISIGTAVGIGACCFIRLLCGCRNYQPHNDDELDNTSIEAIYEEVSDNYHVQIHPRITNDSLESVD